MSEIDAIIEEIQAIAKDLSYTTSDNNDRKILQVLLRLAWQVQELETHQHSYFGPADMHGKWATTGEQRDTGAAAHAQYLKAQADKKKATS